MTCECDLRYRRWNPYTRRCETCGCKFPAHRNRPGQNTSLGDLFGEKLAAVKPSDGDHMQTEEYWLEVWKD